MKQTHFESRYSQEWQDFDKILEPLEKPWRRRKKETLDANEIFSFSKRYRRLCHYLSMSKERGYSNHLVTHLNELVTRGHAILYHHKPTAFLKMIRFFLNDYPVLIRKEFKWLTMACLLFFGTLAIMCLATFLYPDLAYAVFSPETVSNYEAMYDGADSIKEQRGSHGDFAMFGFYILNNISIGFRTFASGLLFGIGSVFFLLFNGVAIGTVMGHMIDPAYATTFFSFVIGHGSFELTAIALSGAAGMKLGASIIAPGRLRRIDSLKKSAKRAIQMIYGVIAMLVIAAFLEAFWSSTVSLTPTIKFSVGGILWLMVIYYFVFMGRGHGTEPG